MRNLYLSLAARLVWLGLIINAAANSSWSGAVFNGLIFLGSAFLIYLGRQDKEYYLLDALVSATFATALIVSLFLTWQTPGTLAFDKIFHALGGMCLAWFATLLYRDRIQHRGLYAVAIVTFALALGAVWEIYEWVLSLLPVAFATPFNPYGLADSFGDLIADTIGAIVIATVELWRRK